MDDFNNNNNPFNEENNGNNGQYTDPYNTPPHNDQYNGQYNGQYNVPPQNGQYQQGGYYNQQNIPQQGYAQPQGYPQGYYGMPCQQPSTGMAVASLVLGIVSIVAGLFMFTFPVLFLMPIIGLILGILFKTKRLPVGKGLSTAGIITSAIGLVLPIILIIVIMMWVFTDSGTEFMRNALQQIKATNPEQYQQFYDQLGGQFPQWFSVLFTALLGIF